MGLFFYKKIRNPFSRMHSPSRFPLDLSEKLSLYGHGRWISPDSKPVIHPKSAIEKEREIRGDPLFSACALVKAMGCHRGYGESGKPWYRGIPRRDDSPVTRNAGNGLL